MIVKCIHCGKMTRTPSTTACESDNEIAGICNECAVKILSPSNQARAYLNELMFHIRCTHCDMGGKHRYTLAAAAYPLVNEIKAWLSEEL